MSGTSEDRFYNLLPELYRRRDLASGKALRALMAVLESQFLELEGDITAGYNNWFVETCDRWVLPYLAVLVGLPDLSRQKHLFSTQRRQVANTVGYRCRKGTLATLEHVVRDATEWLACAVEYDQRLEGRRHLECIPPELRCTANMRRTGNLAELGGPLDGLAYTAQVSSEQLENAPPGVFHSSQYDAGGIGLYIWRLRSLRMTNSHPCRIIVDPDLISFLNHAENESEIVQRISDDPRFGPFSLLAYGVRSSLAKAILNKRDSLPYQRFESLKEVDNLPGVGTDTLHDMLSSFPGFYTFHPLGLDLPLFNWPQYISRIDQQAESNNIPFALKRSDLAVDLEEYNTQFGHRPEIIRPPNSRYYGPERGINIALWRSGSSQHEPPVSIPPSGVLSMDLSWWDSDVARMVLERNPQKVVAIDVELGRLAFLPNEPYLRTGRPIPEEDILITYCYGSSTEIGGGPYHRGSARLFSLQVPFHIDVAKGAAGGGGGQKPKCVSTINEALRYWRDSAPTPRGFIRILDNGKYDEELEIRLSHGASLTIMADNGVRPVIGKHGMTIVACDTGAGGKRELHLDGLLIHGGLQIDVDVPEGIKLTGGMSVGIKHCTLVRSDGHRLKPAAIEGKRENAASPGLEINIESSIVGPLYLPPEAETLRVNKSIVDNGPDYAISADSTSRHACAVCLEGSTILGKVRAQKVTACNVIFASPIQAPWPETLEQIQHSYIPLGSLTLEGMPPLEISRGISPPRFTSTHYGDPGYAQLSLDCPAKIRGGAADGSEMGAFHDLYQPRAEENLREVLDEYLPLGLEPHIHYVT